MSNVVMVKEEEDNKGKDPSVLQGKDPDKSASLTTPPTDDDLPERAPSVASSHENFSDDDFTGSSDTGSHNYYKKKQQQQDTIAHEESRAVSCVRLLTLCLLLAVTAGVATAVYYYISKTEEENFHNDFDYSSSKVLESVGQVLDQSLSAIDNYMVAIVSHAVVTNQTWPQVTLPDVAVRAQKVLSLSKASHLGVYPKVAGGAARSEWERWAMAHDHWIDTSLQVQREDATYEGTHVDEWFPADSISGFDGPLPRDMPGPHYPTYYAAPIAPLDSAYGLDLYQAHGPELDEMEWKRTVTMSRTLNIADPHDEAAMIEQENNIEWISSLIGPDLDPTEPLVGIYYPIVQGAQTRVSMTDSDHDQPIVGAIGMTIFWRELLQNILSPGSNGIVVVVENACHNSSFTYNILGPDVEYLGRGDLHDTGYGGWVHEATLHSLSLLAAGGLHGSGSAYTGIPLSDLCTYKIAVYPSDTLRDEHETKNPVIFTVVAISIFLFTTLVFFLYDCVSERRQRKVLRVALQSSALVSSLFPQVVRDRVFPGGPNGTKKKEGGFGRVENAKQRLQHFLRSDGGEVDKEDPMENGSGGHNNNAPIAELFTDTTVMFADIAGFTAWSSAREPAQVFTLLEALYGAFDKIAQRRKVFKVETIGDSYVAVCGLPEPRMDHAIVMAKFARDCRLRVQELTTKLARTLGPDTAELQIRTGLNSGPVTAGVLRGERSRFQLFGDTVNTAARMESTGIVSKIQVSQSTAELIKIAGKGHWLSKREEAVQAKGKGLVQTWFVEPSAHAVSNSSSEIEDDDDFLTLDEKTRRLCDWNVAIMTKLLKQVVARREAWKKIGRNRATSTKKKSDAASVSSHSGANTVLDEVLEVIQLPAFDPRLAQNTKDATEIELSPIVTTQIKDFVLLLASMYLSNSFHNFEHASHVAMSVIKLLSRIVAPSDGVIQDTQEGKGGLASTLHDHTYGITSDPLTQFACFFSALIHDVDHQGIPNTQLIVENSPLVEKYRGKSLAEQNSVDLSWRILMDDQFEDLRNVIAATPEEMAHFRHLVVNSVMATDIMDKDLKTLRNNRWEKAFSKESLLLLGESEETKINRKATIVIEHLIQASDVAHTMQHWHIYRKWNENLFKEMYHAFKAGRSASNPADFWYKGELGFFDFYIIPLAKKLSDCGVFGVASDEYLSYAMKNREEWEARGQEMVALMLAKLEVPSVVVTANANTLGTSENPSNENNETNTLRDAP